MTKSACGHADLSDLGEMSVRRDWQRGRYWLALAWLSLALMLSACMQVSGRAGAGNDNWRLSLTPEGGEVHTGMGLSDAGNGLAATSMADDGNVQEGAPPARPKHKGGGLPALSGPAREKRQKLGDALTEKVLANVRLSRDVSLKARLEHVLARLAAAARREYPWPERWRIYIIDDVRADAFTAGGGHLFITTAMIDLLQTDERLATVLAHEMAHNLLGHVWDAHEKKDMARRAHAFSREVLARKWRMPWLGKSVAFIVDTSLNTYSRQQEYEADAEGLHLLVRAGYRPQVALETFDFLRRHFREQGALENFFYNHHPPYDRRRRHLVNRIRAYYRAEAGLPPVRRANWHARH